VYYYMKILLTLIFNHLNWFDSVKLRSLVIY